MATIENLKHFKTLEDMAEVGERMHPKVFGIRLPESAAEKLLRYKPQQRTMIMRKAVLNVIAELS